MAFRIITYPNIDPSQPDIIPTQVKVGKILGELIEGTITAQICQYDQNDQLIEGLTRNVTTILNISDLVIFKLFQNGSATQEQLEQLETTILNCEQAKNTVI